MNTAEKYRTGEKERELFLGGHAREQERQANGNKISYLILLEITARLTEYNKCSLK